MIAAGETVGPYRVLEPLGRGGMASVYKAYEATLDRFVALKVMPPEFMHDPTFAERFRREAQTIAKLEHPHIIPIYGYDIDLERRIPWMAMRMIAGGTLSSRLREGKMSHAESVRVLQAVAEALDYAHRSGVVHRDVKPQNVLMDKDGPVYLADFGIAKIVEGNSGLTATGMITGTPQYMAPEQALGGSITGAADIYALGIMTYELFTGRVPFSADTPVAVLMKHASEPMPVPKPGEVPDAITKVILKATAKDAKQRFATASEFSRALGAAGAQLAASGDLGVAVPIVPADQDAPTVLTGSRSAATSSTAPTMPRTPAAAPAARASAGSPREYRSSGGMFAVAVIALLALGTIGGAAMWWRAQQAEAQAGAGVTSTQDAAAAAAGDRMPGSGAVAGVESASPAPVVNTPLPEVPPAATVAPEPAPAVAAGSNDPRAEQPSRPMRPGVAARQAFRDAVRENRAAGIGGGAAAGGQIPETPSAPSAPAAANRMARVRLLIEAVQPTQGSQMNAIFLEVSIDGGQPRFIPVRFMGASPYQKWRRIERVDLGEVPASAREIHVAASTDRSMDSDRMEETHGLELKAGEETVVPIQVRYISQFDRAIRFRAPLIDDDERARERAKQ